MAKIEATSPLEEEAEAESARKVSRRHVNGISKNHDRGGDSELAIKAIRNFPKRVEWKIHNTVTGTVLATPKISIIEGKSCLPRGQHVNALAHWAPTKTLRLYLGPL